MSQKILNWLAKMKRDLKTPWKFVRRYKETRTRMNWRGCYDMLKKKSNVIQYKTSKVLYTAYNSFKTRSQNASFLTIVLIQS